MSAPIAFAHTSIMVPEVVAAVVTDPEGIYVDCTLGGGGHSEAIASALGAGATLIGIDQDSEALSAAAKRLEGKYPCKMTLQKANFRELGSVLDGLGIEKVNGIFFDLGVSSYQLDNPERGFSYMQNGPLDMRMDAENGREETAEHIVNTWSEKELAQLFKTYGEERRSKAIARLIVAKRAEEPITTTFQLVDIIKEAIPKKYRIEGPHPAKRTFQAIRIQVNGELSILEGAVREAAERLQKGGRLAVITFHSLEDRIVKQTIAELVKGCTCPPQLPVCVCGKKPLLTGAKNTTPSPEEVERNPRSRSARLRYATKL